MISLTLLILRQIFNRKWYHITHLLLVPFSAPSGCLQYHTGIDGRFETFNFPGGSPVEMHLPNQDYQICVRQEEGNL